MPTQTRGRMENRRKEVGTEVTADQANRKRLVRIMAAVREREMNTKKKYFNHWVVDVTFKSDLAALTSSWFSTGKDDHELTQQGGSLKNTPDYNIFMGSLDPKTFKSSK